MAILFDDASTEYLELDSAPVTAAPFTMACWFNSDSATLAQTLMCVADKDVEGHYFALAIRGNATGDPVSFIRNAASVNLVSTTSGYTADTWHHACAVAIAADNVAVYIDGGSEGTGSTSVTPAGCDRISIGVNGDSSPTGYMSGSIAEAAIWSVALAAADIDALAHGASPLLVRTASLVAYWPLLRLDCLDWLGGYSLTAYNTPAVADHPLRIQYPLRWMG